MRGGQVKGVQIPLFHDFGPYVSFLFALPILIMPRFSSIPARAKRFIIS
jgi:hypothetical protein